MSHAADLGKTAPNPSWNTPASSGPSHHPQAAAALSKDDIREAQLELRHSGLYNGSLDGVIGPQTKQALVRFQKENGLEQTATLDALTMVAMFGNIGTSESSGMPVRAPVNDEFRKPGGELDSLTSKRLSRSRRCRSRRRRGRSLPLGFQRSLAKSREAWVARHTMHRFCPVIDVSRWLSSKSG